MNKLTSITAESLSKMTERVVGKKAGQQVVQTSTKKAFQALDQKQLTIAIGETMAPVTFSVAKLGDRAILPLIDNYHKTLMERSPELIARKFEAMAEAPFPFFRASAFLFYHDVKAVPELTSKGVEVHLQGDFHLENMGTYRTANGRTAYDLNDFDEAFFGPHTWELGRMGTSIHLAGKEVGLKSGEREELVGYFLKRYQTHLKEIEKNPGQLEQILDETMLQGKAANQVEQAAERFSRTEWLNEMTQNGQFRITNKVRPVSSQERAMVEHAIQEYAKSRPEGAEFFTIKDIASRIAGKGSLGLGRYDVIIEGASKKAEDNLILEIKEARVPSAVLAGIEPSANEAQRIVDAYKRTLPDVDPYLGVTKLGEADAYVRELLPKETVNLEKVNKVGEFEEFLDDVALIIARSHARSGNVAQLIEKTPDAEKTVIEFAADYYRQVKTDFKAFAASQ